MFIHSVVMMVHVFSSSLVTDKLHYLHTNMNKDWVEYVSGQKNGKILCLYLHIKYYKTVQYCLLHLSVYLTLHTFFFMISIWLKFCGTEMNKKMTAFDVWIYMYVNVYKWTTLMVLVVVGLKDSDVLMNILKIWDQLISKTVHFVFIFDIKQLSCN